ncbi:uncharacterized protein [Clinocottus analis]|uniref:uncharacterized protein isoform X1 n=1 Tax=Clinocottus analis TaxID=304258 RepID=UPI0035C09703
MKAVAALVALLMNVRLSLSCGGEGTVMICSVIPPGFMSGYSSVWMILHGVGEINSTVFRSDSLVSVTRLRIEGAGVTGIAEGAFSSFMTLTNLGLNHNLLTEINPNWVGRADILGELNLTDNQIEVLHESTLNGFLNLTRLRLSHNRITTIHPNSFSSQSVLAELDLSENRMTRVSPQAFRSLRSTRIRLDGNPWDCSCGAEDFVDFLKDLQSRSLLDRPLEVTCDSPPSLRGQPVWNVSSCVASPPPRPSSVSVHPKPTDIITAVPGSTSVVTTPPSRPTSERKTSVRPKPTDITTSSNTASRVTEISVRPPPSDPPRPLSPPTGMTETCASDTNIVFTLAVVIAVLCFFLLVQCLLALLHWRKRNSKTVTPGRPEENRTELKGDSGSSAQTPGRSEGRENNRRDSETGWRTSFTGVRAKSANAILFSSPFCAPVKDEVTLQTETEAQSEDAESRAGGKRKLGDEAEVDGGVETADGIIKAKRAEAGGDRDENAHRVPVNANAVPYLSIGTSQNKPGPDDVDEQAADASGQRWRKGKVMGRISTWPPTAVQWQARCETEEGEEGSAAFTVWTPKFPGEKERELKREERPSGSDWDRKEDDTEDIRTGGFTAPNQAPSEMTAAPVMLGRSQPSKPSDKTTRFSADARPEQQLEEDEETIPDPVTMRQTQTLDEILCPNQDLKSAASPAQKTSGSKAEQGGERKRAATSRRRADNGSTGPKAPSGGASPDDETLLSGNEYAFMDLLHEVVQNNGRWTRDRWKQKEVNKQRRHDR